MSSNVMDIFLSVKIDEETDDLHRTLSTLREIVNLQTIATSLGDDVKIKADTDDIEEKIKEIKELIKSDDEDDDSGVSDQIKNLDFKIDSIVTDVDFMRSNLFMLSSSTSSKEFDIEKMAKMAADPSAEIARFMSSAKDPNQFYKHIGENPQERMGEMFSTMLLKAADLMSKGVENKFTKEVASLSRALGEKDILSGTISKYLDRFSKLFVGGEEEFQAKVLFGDGTEKLIRRRFAKGMKKGDEHRLIGREQATMYGLVGAERIADIRDELFEAKITPQERIDITIADAMGKSTTDINKKIIDRLKDEFKKAGFDPDKFDYRNVMFDESSLINKGIKMALETDTSKFTKEELERYEKVRQSHEKRLRPDWEVVATKKFIDEARKLSPDKREEYTEKEVLKVYENIEPQALKAVSGVLMKLIEDTSQSEGFVSLPFKNLSANMASLEQDIKKARHLVQGIFSTVIVPTGAKLASVPGVTEVSLTQGLATEEEIEEFLEKASYMNRIGVKESSLRKLETAIDVNDKVGIDTKVLEKNLEDLVEEIKEMKLNLENGVYDV